MAKPTTIQEPQMKKELAVASYREEWWWIDIDATIDAIQEYARFGRITAPGPYQNPDRFTLWVDARFDFDEVLAWLQAHGERVDA